MTGSAGLLRVIELSESSIPAVALQVKGGNSDPRRGPELAANAWRVTHVGVRQAGAVISSMTTDVLTWENATVDVAGDLIVRLLRGVINGVPDQEVFPPGTVLPNASRTYSPAVLPEDPTQHSTAVRGVTLVGGCKSPPCAVGSSYATDQPLRVAPSEAGNATLTWHVPGALPPALSITVHTEFGAATEITVQSQSSNLLEALVRLTPGTAVYERYATVRIVSDRSGAYTLAPPVAASHSTGVVNSSLFMSVWASVGTVFCTEHTQSDRVTRVDGACQVVGSYSLSQPGFHTVRVRSLFNATLFGNATHVVHESEDVEWSYVVDPVGTPLPVPTVTPVHIGTKASFDSTSLFNVTLGPTYFAGDRAPYVECRLSVSHPWTKCGGWGWPDGELLTAQLMPPGDYSLEARTVVGYDAPARIESRLAPAVNWTVGPKAAVPVPAVLAPVVLPGTVLTLVEPVVNVSIARLQPLASFPPIGTTCNLSPSIEGGLGPCSDAYTEGGINVTGLPPHDYVLMFRHFFIDFWTREESTTASATLTTIPFKVVPNAAALAIDAVDGAYTLQRHALFTATATLLSGDVCADQCRDFVCKVSYEADWRKCDDGATAGRAVASYEVVPPGTHTFTVSVTDTGFWEATRANSLFWSYPSASYVSACSVR